MDEEVRMRRGVAALCVVLVLPVMRAKAESAVSAADAASMRVERPWLQTGLDRGPDERLGQAETSTRASRSFRSDGHGPTWGSR
jgi:hypothetical protein